MTDELEALRSQLSIEKVTHGAMKKQSDLTIVALRAQLAAAEAERDALRAQWESVPWDALRTVSAHLWQQYAAADAEATLAGEYEDARSYMPMIDAIDGFLAFHAQQEAAE